MLHFLLSIINLALECIRDELGLFVGAKTLWLDLLMAVRVGEAKLLLGAISLIIELGFDRVIFTTDAKYVADNFNSLTQDNAKYGAIIRQCRYLVESSCSNSHVEFSRREANMVAH